MAWLTSFTHVDYILHYNNVSGGVYVRRHLFLSLLRVAAWIYSLVGGSARAYTLAGSRYRPRIRHTLLKELWLRALGQ
jgi:hypothetical protein